MDYYFSSDISRMSLTREDLDEWVKALRSGEFKQGFGKLQSPSGSYCVLGVKCELDARKGLLETSYHYYRDPKGQWQDTMLTPRQRDLYKTDYSGPDVRLSNSVFSELAPKVPRFRTLPRVGRLSVFNDLKVPFPVLADLLEEHIVIVPFYEELT